jgi:UDP-N-acetylmuramate--alanine ligase
MDRLSSVFDCFQAEKLVGRFNLALAGEHNISNSLAVIALGLELGIGIEKIKTALATYPGASRRLELKFSGRDCLLIDDYAHHPSEIKATLKALLNLHAKRIVAVFQPHRYSRTRLLLEEFALSFDLADYLIITDIYPAGESPIAAVSAQAIYEKIKLHSPEKKIYYLPKDELVGYLLGLIRPGDLVLTMGAGDIVGVADELAARLKVKGQV